MDQQTKDSLLQAKDIVRSALKAEPLPIAHTQAGEPEVFDPFEEAKYPQRADQKPISLPDLGYREGEALVGAKRALSGISGFYKDARGLYKKAKGYSISGNAGPVDYTIDRKGVRFDGTFGDTNYTLSKNGLSLNGTAMDTKFSANANKNGDAGLSANRKLFGGDLNVSANRNSEGNSFRLDYQKKF